jgi:DNA-binding CsgD family transcriptional regulator
MSENSDLSERELEVLALVAAGASNKEIAHSLSISKNTVKVHLRNIFTKTESASRTEAAMYAVRIGLVQPEQLTEGKPLQPETGVLASARSRQARRARLPGSWVLVGAVALALVAVALASVFTPTAPAPPATGPSPAVTPVLAAGWTQMAPLSAPREKLAAVDYDGQIYAIGGQSETGVVGLLERYDPAADRWQALPEKPTAVADAAAVVIGGKIYLPGGRLQDGSVSDVLEFYDPRTRVWGRGARMPERRSAYGLSAFEGQLYLFGGWDGDQYVADVFTYDPDGDRWEVLEEMPTARGFPGVAAAGGRIYVLGGTDGQRPLAVNEVFQPGLEQGAGSAWQTLTPLPEGRYGMGVLNVVDTLFVLGGQGREAMLASLKYLPESDSWQASSLELAQPWADFGFVIVGSDIYALGGRINGELLPLNISYQAVFTIAIPVIQDGGQ